MTLVRILVDGHSLLEQWKDLAPGKPRHSEVAREELIARLTRYSDTVGTSITVVFDGSTSPGDPILLPPAGPVEVLFSRPGQKANQYVERLAQRLNGHGEFLVVADVLPRPETIHAVKGSVSNCAGFIEIVQETLADLDRQIASFNQKENQKFTQHG